MQPERVGRYRIVEELGRGGFATVYLGEDRGLDDLVAIKVLAETHAADADSVARFVAEARVMRNLKAPGVVTVHDVGEHDGQPYFVMEYCQRGTLSERLEQLGRPVTVDEGMGLAAAIATAMDGLHASNPPVVHRDIKPGNLLIRHRPTQSRAAVGQLLAGDEELIVGDFGLAKVVDLQSTKLSLIAYTRGFAPPEQIRGDGTIGPSADVYSASAVVVAALSGEKPEQVFADSDSAFSDEAFMATGQLRVPLERGLRFNRGDRHDSISEWSRALTSAPPQTALVDGPDPSWLPPGAPPPTAASFNTASLSAGPPSAAPSYAAPPAQPVSAAPQSTPISAPLPSMPGRPQTGRPKRRLLPWFVVGVVPLVAAVIGVVALQARSDAAIVGPDEVLVGDEVAFTVNDGSVVIQEWQAGGQTVLDPVLRLTPQEPGRVTVTLVTADGQSTKTIDVRSSDSMLRISGPAVLTVGQTSTLEPVGTSGPVTWTVSGQVMQLDRLELRPRSTGVVQIGLTAGGETVERSFTVVEDSGP